VPDSTIILLTGLIQRDLSMEAYVMDAFGESYGTGVLSIQHIYSYCIVLYCVIDMENVNGIVQQMQKVPMLFL